MIKMVIVLTMMVAFTQAFSAGYSMETFGMELGKPAPDSVLKKCVTYDSGTEVRVTSYLCPPDAMPVQQHRRTTSVSLWVYKGDLVRIGEDLAFREGLSLICTFFDAWVEKFRAPDENLSETTWGCSEWTKVSYQLKDHRLARSGSEDLHLTVKASRASEGGFEGEVSVDMYYSPTRRTVYTAFQADQREKALK